MSLTAKPASPALTGMPVTLVAVPTGGVNVLYAFWLGTQQADGTWKYAELRAAGPQACCPWTPQAPGSYLLIVDAREAGASTTASIAVPYTVEESK